ncbi:MULTISPECIES: ATP-binding protein [Kitasatospora]|uniref:ATP-binding protein n=1 Tax=Kitasatospora TaxID=2063 RepID=UPI0031D7817B
MSQGLDFTRTALADWHLPTTAGQVAADTVLVAAELLTNAAQHAGRPLVLQLHRTPERLRIAVTDPSPTPPHRVEPHRPHVPHGHGLVVVDRITTDWGCTLDGNGGKTVWADLSLPSRSSRCAAAPDPQRARRAALADPDPLLDN